MSAACPALYPDRALALTRYSRLPRTNLAVGLLSLAGQIGVASEGERRSIRQLTQPDVRLRRDPETL
jgi:hypothetical protein